MNEKPENIYSIYYPTITTRIVDKVIELELPASSDGIHTLTLTPNDPAIVFEKIVIDGRRGKKRESRWFRLAAYKPASLHTLNNYLSGIYCDVRSEIPSLFSQAGWGLDSPVRWTFLYITFACGKVKGSKRNDILVWLMLRHYYIWICQTLSRIFN